VISDCKYGLVIKDSCTATIQHATVVRCERGVDCYEKTPGTGGSHGTADGLIVWDNGVSVKLDALSTFEATHSTFAGGYPGTGNIALDPLFVDAAKDDFHLVPGSPAAGAAKDGTDMGAYTGAPSVQGFFIRADANDDTRVDISDAVMMLIVLFRQDVTPRCLDALDANDDGLIDLADAIYVLGYSFAAGPAPSPPFPEAGQDPTDPHDCGKFVYFR